MPSQELSTFIASLTAAQNAAWYVPFVWPALIISSVAKGLFLQSLGLRRFICSALIAGLYYLAVELNKRFGLYEPPAITLQKGGVYAPKIGLLGKLGFSSVEAALIRKDLRAFTRRRELLGIYILPIIIVIISIFYSFGITGGGSSLNLSSLVRRHFLGASQRHGNAAGASSDRRGRTSDVADLCFTNFSQKLG